MPRLSQAVKDYILVLLIILLLVGLPVAAWLDLSNLVETNLRRQANDVNSIISSVRHYYANNVVGRILASPGTTKVVHNYKDIPGAIPIPATLSLELGRVISEQQHNIKYRFVSDYPFINRAPHAFDEFETGALVRLRQDSTQQLTRVSSSVFTDGVRLIAPVIMEQPCVSCHNSHPESPKTDWKVGDVRGIQEVSIAQPISGNLFTFKYLLAYFVLTAAVGSLFIGMQRRQAATISGMNAELEAKNEFLDSLSTKISRYLSPQIYRSIFSGQKDVTIHTERKKVTIFFSDVKDFTGITDRVQPEQITQLLNEYFTEMSRIALAHGGTVDKFVGDAMLVFFGDPESKGDVDDAKSCLRMAIEMQNRIMSLNAEWHSAGIEESFHVRMGINTGFCNVGNFGSNDRMDYTIVGAEVNLTARLQSIAKPGDIVVSYETYALVRDMVVAQALKPITIKGINREVVPYLIQSAFDSTGKNVEVFSEHVNGLDLYFNAGVIDATDVEHVRDVLEDALKVLEKLDS